MSIQVGGDPVLAHGLVLQMDVLAFFLVGRQPQASDTGEAVAGERFHPVERTLRPVPELPRTLVAVGLAGDVVPGRAAAQREASVASARSLGDAALVVNTDAQSAFGEPQRR